MFWIQTREDKTQNEMDKENSGMHEPSLSINVEKDSKIQITYMAGIYNILETSIGR